LHPFGKFAMVRYSLACIMTCSVKCADKLSTNQGKDKAMLQGEPPTMVH